MVHRETVVDGIQHSGRFQSGNKVIDAMKSIAETTEGGSSLGGG